MKNLAEKIQRIISGNTLTSFQGKSHPFDCIKTKKGILRELLISQESGNLIGIFSPALGEGMFLILVHGIESQHYEEVITIQKYDIGDSRVLSTAKLSVKDIKGICPFIYNKRLPY